MPFEHFLISLFSTEGIQFAHIHLALILAFFGLLRCSNLTVQKHGEIDLTRDILLTDVKDCGSHLVINIKWSKANQTGGDILVLPRSISDILCPVTAWRNYLDKYLKIVNVSDLPLLMNDNFVPIHGDKLRSLFREVFEAGGISAFGYTPHSLRHGGTSFYADNGIPLDSIPRHGLWKSDAIEVYLRKISREQTSIFKFLGSL